MVVRSYAWAPPAGTPTTVLTLASSRAKTTSTRTGAVRTAILPLKTRRWRNLAVTKQGDASPWPRSGSVAVLGLPAVTLKKMTAKIRIGHRYRMNRFFTNY